MESSPSHFRYRPEIDGLRAIAVIAVVLFHANFCLPGGYVGVDVFFVISGYLITNLLIRDIDNQKFSLVGFWERRLRRIVPALFVVSLATLLAGAWILLPADFSKLGESAVAQATMLANVFFWRETGYFGGPAELSPLLHTWSLAVEEQFYLFFPLLLCFLAQHFRQSLGRFLIFGALVSFGASVYGVAHFPSATFFLLPTRAWELLTGSLLACFRVPSALDNRTIRETASGLGIGMIVYACFAFDKATDFPGTAALIPVLGTALFIGSNESKPLSIAGKILASPPLVAVGLISYSLYLWHWPIFAYLRYITNDCSPAVLLWGCAASGVLAILSYFLVEQPFRRITAFKNRRFTYISSAIMIASIGILGTVMVINKGYPNRFDQHLALCLADVQNTGEEFQTTLTELQQQGMHEIGSTEDGKLPKFALIGDSHAMIIAPFLDELAKKRKIPGAVATNQSTIPLTGVWSSRRGQGDASLAWNKEVLELIKQQKVKHVVLAAAWSIYLGGWQDEALKHSPELATEYSYATCDLEVPLSAESAYSALAHGFISSIDQWERDGVHVWILPQAPEATEPEVARRFLRWQLYPNINSPIQQRGQSLQSYLNRTAPESKLFSQLSKRDNVTVLNLQDAFFEDTGYTSHHSGERAFYRDMGHVTISCVREKYRLAIEEFLDSITE